MGSMETLPHRPPPWASQRSISSVLTSLPGLVGSSSKADPPLPPTDPYVHNLYISLCSRRFPGPGTVAEVICHEQHILKRSAINRPRPPKCCVVSVQYHLAPSNEHEQTELNQPPSLHLPTGDRCPFPPPPTPCCGGCQGAPAEKNQNIDGQNPGQPRTKMQNRPDVGGLSTPADTTGSRMGPKIPRQRDKRETTQLTLSLFS